MQELNWLINACFTIFMAGLFVWDYKSFGEPTHKDFKSIIMSTGVLGTFVGIFVGLMGFDTLSLQDSVPLLLDGLKTAFYTSILGMGLAIALSIIQRAKGVKSSQDASMDYLVHQAGNLNYLKGIEDLNLKLAGLPTKADMLQANATTNVILETSFKHINQSLQEAIEQLASGASKELIAALELVIRDFNQNLQNQFGENFKELNNAVGRLLAWQENYKVSIEQTQELLMQTRQSMQESFEAMSHTQNTLDSITRQNASAMEFYTNTMGVVDDLKARGEVLQAQLSEVSSLGENARVCLGDMDKFFIQAAQNFKTLESEAMQSLSHMQRDIESQVQNLQTYTQDNLQILKKFLEESSAQTQESAVSVLSQHTDSMRSYLEGFSQDTQAMLKELVSGANSQLETLSQELERNLVQSRESTEQNTLEFARLKEHIATNNTAILEGIQGSLSQLSAYNKNIMQDLSSGLQSMQEKYLSTLSASMDSVMNKEQEIVRQRVESLSELVAKTDTNLNVQYENVSKFLRKMASEYLKIMQKVTKDSVAIPKDMGVQVVQDFGDLQHNLLSHLGNLNAQIQHNSVQLVELYRNMQNMFNENIEGNKMLQGEIRNTFVSLDESMSASMENFKENYEWFLRRVREMIGSKV